MIPAIVLLEFRSIAVGLQAADAMAKRAPLDRLYVGTVQPGKLLVLAGGEVASVEEAWMIGREVGGSELADQVYLPDVHPEIPSALAGAGRSFGDDAVGVVETRHAASTIRATDAALKGTRVTLAELRLADGLGGKGYALYDGDVAEVEAAVELAVAAIPEREVVARVVIPRLHPEVAANLRANAEFHQRMVDHREGAA